MVFPCAVYCAQSLNSEVQWGIAKVFIYLVDLKIFNDPPALIISPPLTYTVDPYGFPEDVPA